MTVLVVLAILFGFYMAWNIGANDAANSMADAVGSRSIGLVGAVILGSICEFAGAVLVGARVTNTIRKGIIDTSFFQAQPQSLAVAMLCALLAAALWLHIATWYGMPVSTTHSIVGAVAGAGIALAGFAHVQWATMAKIVASWFISPVAGGVGAFVTFRLFTRYMLGREDPLKAARRCVPVVVFVTVAVVLLVTLFKGLKHVHIELTSLQALGVSAVGGLLGVLAAHIPVRRMLDSGAGMPLAAQLERLERIFAVLVVITSCSVAFAHGANDVANAVGPVSAILEIVRTGDVPGKVPVDVRILLLGGLGISIGLATMGYRVMRVVGTRITDLTPSRGVAADLSTSIVVLVFSRLGIPISTTHTLVGAVIGVGLARGITAVNRQKVNQIFVSWLATVPIAAAITIVLCLVGRLLGLA